MPKKLLRPKVARERVAVGKTHFEDNYVNHGGAGQECIPDTDIPRLRPIRLGIRCIAFPEDEVDALIEALARQRDSHPETMLPRAPARRATAAPPLPPTRHASPAAPRPTPRPTRRPIAAARR
jgi:hypothetical protein